MLAKTGYDAGIKTEIKFLFWVPFLPSPSSHIPDKYLVHEQILDFEELPFSCAWDLFLGETQRDKTVHTRRKWYLVETLPSLIALKSFARCSYGYLNDVWNKFQGCLPLEGFMVLELSSKSQKQAKACSFQ